MKRTLFLILALAISSAASAQMRGYDTSGPSGMQMGQLGSVLAYGEVRRIDEDAGKLTLRHEPIASLAMPAMTMVYRVTAPAMLDQVNAGNTVRFTMERIGDALTVTRFEVVK